MNQVIRMKRPASVRSPAAGVLANDVGQEAEEAGALDGTRELALLLGDTAVIRLGTILPRSDT